MGVLIASIFSYFTLFGVHDSVLNYEECAAMKLNHKAYVDGIYTYSFEFSGSDFRGKVKFDEKSNRLFISSPQAFNGNFSTGSEEAEFFNETVSCLFNGVGFEGLDVEKVVFDFSPKYYLCKGLRYYSKSDRVSFITSKQVPESVFDPLLAGIVEFSDDAGYFEEWRILLNNYGLILKDIKEDWLEVFTFFELHDAMSITSSVNEYCSLSEEDMNKISATARGLLIPVKLSKIELEVASKL